MLASATVSAVAVEIVAAALSESAPVSGARVSSIHSSPPSRRRGLKPFVYVEKFKQLVVASLAEAWIETYPLYTPEMSPPVASLAEAWIETPVR